MHKRSKMDKIRIAKVPHYTIHASKDIVKKDGSQNTLFGLLFEGTENCCQIKAKPVAVQPEETPNQTADMFENDPDLKEQEMQAQLKKEEEEREAQKAAKKAEQARIEKEKKEKERRKKTGPSWIQRKIDSLTKEFFDDDAMK